MSFMHGAQDGQKFIGVLFLGVAFASGQPDVAGAVIPVWLMVLCSATMGLGTSVGGEKIIKSVGMDMVKLEKYQGFSADLSSSLCLLVMTVLPYRPRTPRQVPSWASVRSAVFLPLTLASLKT